MIIWYLQNFKQHKDELLGYNVCRYFWLSSSVYMIVLPDEQAPPWLQNETEVEQYCNIVPFYFRFPSRKEVDQYQLPRMVAFVTLVLMNCADEK